MNEGKFGALLTPDAKLHRKYFEELVTLLGIQVFYRAPKSSKRYTTYTEIESLYYPPEAVGVIFDEHPTQQTLKKMGWISELQENASVIHVPYDLKFLQQGALFFIPSGLDNVPNRLFRVTKLSNSMVYPASISCEIVPEFENSYSIENDNFKSSSFNVLAEEDDYI